jgi:hypothetical protein
LGGGRFTVFPGSMQFYFSSTGAPFTSFCSV